MKSEFPAQIFGKYSSVFMNIRPVGAELLHAGGLTDGHREADSFLSFAKAPKNQSVGAV